VKRFVMILLAAPLLAAGAEVESAATRDAKGFAACIKALNMECIVSFSYRDKANTEHPDGRELLVADINGRYGPSATGAKVSEFTLLGPSPEFTGDGRRFVFIPYYKYSSSPGVSYLNNGFLIGVSIDDGMTWKFLDNWRSSAEAVLSVYPGYAGQPPIPKTTGMSIGHNPGLMPR
jgi:hypothetical protein